MASISYAIPWPDTIKMNVTIADLLYGLAFYLIIITNLILKKTLFPLLEKKFLTVWIILFFLGFGNLLGLIRSTNATESIGNFVQYIFIFVALLTVIHYLVDSKISNAIKVLGVFLIPHILAVLAVLLSKFGIYNAFDSIIIYPTGRYQGFVGLPTTFGNNTATAFAAVLFFLRISKRLISKLLWLISAIAFVYVTLLSGSFGSILILSIAVLGFLWFGAKKKVLMRTIAISVVFAVSFVFYQIEVKQNYDYLTYAPKIIQERFVKSGNDFGSLELRTELNELGIKEFVDNPILGVGYGQFKFHNVHGLNVHNTFISAAVEMGILGFMGVFLYVLMPLVYSLKMMLSKLYKPKTKEFIFISFLILYSLIRLAMTFNGNEFISRDPWVPALLVFVVYSLSLKTKALKKTGHQKITKLKLNKLNLKTP